MGDRWYFTKEQLDNTPSVRCGYTTDQELLCRQQDAFFIHTLGKRLQVKQLCINTGIVYMHRFYMCHSFTRFNRTLVSTSALFLATKMEEQRRTLEHVVKEAYKCSRQDETQDLDINSMEYEKWRENIKSTESILLMTIGFDDLAIEHPNKHVIQCCQQMKASKDLTDTSYFMASDSIRVTTMCLQYPPSLVACFCIHLAMKYCDWKDPESDKNRPWFSHVDNVTQDDLEQLSAKFINIFKNCSYIYRKKMLGKSENKNPALLTSCGGEGKKPTVTLVSSSIPSNSAKRIKTEVPSTSQPLIQNAQLPPSKSSNDHLDISANVNTIGNFSDKRKKTELDSKSGSMMHSTTNGSKVEQNNERCNKSFNLNSDSNISLFNIIDNQEPSSSTSGKQSHQQVFHSYHKSSNVISKVNNASDQPLLPSASADLSSEQSRHQKKSFNSGVVTPIKSMKTPSISLPKKNPPIAKFVQPTNTNEVNILKRKLTETTGRSGAINKSDNTRSTESLELKKTHFQTVWDPKEKIIFVSTTKIQTKQLSLTTQF